MGLGREQGGSARREGGTVAAAGETQMETKKQGIRARGHERKHRPSANSGDRDGAGSRRLGGS